MLDQSILDEVEMMKRTQSSRREMSYHVARRLLIDMSIRPSTQLVREYTQQGSTGDVAADLRFFWVEVARQLKTPPLLNVKNLDSTLRAKTEELLSQLVESIENKFLSDKNKEIEKLELSFKEKENELTESARQTKESYTLKEKEHQNRIAALLHDNLLLSQQLDLANTTIGNLRTDISKEIAQSQAQKEMYENTIQRIHSECQDKIKWLEETKEVLDGEIQFAKSQIEESRQLYKKSVSNLEKTIDSLKDEIIFKSNVIENFRTKPSLFKVKKRSQR